MKVQSEDEMLPSRLFDFLKRKCNLLILKRCAINSLYIREMSNCKCMLLFNWGCSYFRKIVFLL